MDWKGFLADQMGFFTPADLPGVVLVVLIGAAASWGLGRIAGAPAQAARELAVWGGLAAFAVALVKGSLPMSVSLVALAVLVRADAGVDGKGKLLRTAAVVIGGGCGTGASLVVGVGLLPLALVMRWALRRSGEATP
ncbi:MAG: hypothetical protein IPK99_02920 [Flavobacteriales bacterium]|nr:hypothetical protein [Flavobacteriales bacterium]